MDQFIPSVGMSGLWTLKPPLDAYLAPQTVYTCHTIRSFNELIAQQSDPLNTIYLAIGLTGEDYARDLAAGVYIVSLQSSDGIWKYVPTSYITEFPSAGGVLYQQYMLGIGLPLLPADTDLSTLQTQISSLTQNMLGVVPELKMLSVGSSRLVSDELHETNLVNRSNLKVFIYSDRAHNAVLEEENRHLRSLLGRLEGALLASYHAGNGFVLSSFNSVSPGINGYIDAGDPSPYQPIIATTAIDYYLYGIMQGGVAVATRDWQDRPIWL